jgi:hypothetical protein
MYICTLYRVLRRPRPSPAQTRVRRIRNYFFIRFEANLSEYGSYSLHIRMFRYICQHHLFASYSLQNIRINLHANIYFLIQANNCFKIFVLKRIFAKLSANFTFKIEYSQANIHILVNIRLEIFAC